MSNQIQKINPNDKNYPRLLKEIYDPPKELFFLGEIKAEENLPLAIVGTRKVSNYGKQVTIELGRSLARAGFTIVSGLALGVDGLAHQAAIDVKARTIAVLGCGLDKIYPPNHKKLAEKIITQGGLIISEYPPGTPPLKHHFPTRNRIIAGLSLGVLVIEAPETSGALITARYALEQNREVFAVPGNIFNQNSIGTNQLIKLGAKLVTKPEDIFETFNLDLPKKQKKEIKPANKEEEAILKVLSDEPISIDEIVKQSGLNTSIVSSTLIMMEISGKVKNLGGGQYIIA
jgi:DNA processing protein